MEVAWPSLWVARVSALMVRRGGKSSARRTECPGQVTAKRECLWMCGPGQSTELSCARTPGPGSESQADREAVACVSGASVIRFQGRLPRLFLFVILALSVVWPALDSHVSPPELQRDGSWTPAYARVWWWSRQGQEHLGNRTDHPVVPWSLCCSAWRSWFVKEGTFSAQGPSVAGW